MTEREYDYYPSPPPEHLSFSQVKNLLDCGERYRLTRILGIPDPSGWPLVGGSSFHRATELFDLAYCARNLVSQSDDNVGHVEQTAVGVSGDSQRDRAGNQNPVADNGVTVVNFEPALQQAAQEAARAAISSDADAVTEYLTVLGDLAIQDELQRLALKTGEQDVALMADNLRVSGRASKTWPDKENRAWWEHHLPIWLSSWVDWRKTSGFEMAFKGSEPAIEMDVSGTVGGVGLKAYLDRVFLHPEDGSPVVTDIKTNKMEPTDPEQLGLYSVLLSLSGMPRPQWGMFWMARTGEPGKLHDLSRYTPEYFGWKFKTVKRQRDNNEYVANTMSPFCRTCPVRDYCFAVGGSKADRVPQLWQK